MSRFDGDVRPLSNDQRYMGTVFTGALKSALAQVRAATDHGVTRLRGKAYIAHTCKGMNRNRIALLQHLNLMPL